MPWPFLNTCMLFYNPQMCPKTLVFILTNYFSLDWGIKSWLELWRKGKNNRHLFNWPTSIGKLCFKAGTFFEHMQWCMVFSQSANVSKHIGWVLYSPITFSQIGGITSWLGKCVQNRTKIDIISSAQCQQANYVLWRKLFWTWFDLNRQICPNTLAFYPDQFFFCRLGYQIPARTKMGIFWIAPHQ